MKRILVMGGTRFAGIRLVNQLLREGCNVTIATRGMANDLFEDSIDRIIFDRTDVKSMRRVFAGKRYDVVFDQIGYCADDLAAACEVFSGTIGHYVFTSSNAVYRDARKRGIIEADFDPLQVECSLGKQPGDVGYSTGKQQAESYLARNAPFPYAAARIPIVMAADDPIQRMGFLVGRILDGKPLVIPPSCGLLNYINPEEKGRFLTWLGLSGCTGPYNAGSERWIDPVELTQLTGNILGIEPIIVTAGPDCDRVRFAYPYDMTVDVSKAKRDGFEFTSFDLWFPTVVKDTAQVYLRSAQQ